MKFRIAQSTRTAKFDPRTLSRKYSRKCTRKCTRRCPRKCPQKLRIPVQNAPRGAHEDSHDRKFDSAHENVHESVLGQFHMSYFYMFCSCPEIPLCQSDHGSHTLQIAEKSFRIWAEKATSDSYYAECSSVRKGKGT